MMSYEDVNYSTSDYVLSEEVIVKYLKKIDAVMEIRKE